MGNTGVEDLCRDEEDDVIAGGDHRVTTRNDELLSRAIAPMTTPDGSSGTLSRIARPARTLSTSTSISSTSA